MDEVIKSLQRFDASIKEAETEFAGLGGQLASLEKRLRDEFNLDSVEEAEKHIEKKEGEAKKEEAKILQAYSELQKTYEW